MKTFVEASLRGRKLYEKHGFVVTEEVWLEGGKEREEWAAYGRIPYLFMEREAR